jgi:hypothetical protein
LRVFIGQADTDCIFIAIMQGLGGYRSDIRWVYAWVWQITGWISIHGAVRWITDWIFIMCMHRSGRYRPYIHCIST